ncbi:MAG: ribonucleotide-diphosphate reductase subunit beta [Candidatus Nitrosothermus koennekii]|nr:MAG: ribonucleotide-diphosphate reductase subunit beta [Candidatus Nitrosothermus koennekii]
MYRICMMKLLLLELGILALNDVTKSIRFKDVDEFIQVKNKAYDLSNLLTDIKDKIKINDPSLDIVKDYGFEVELMDQKEQLEIIENKLDLLIKYGFAGNEEEAKLLLREFAIKLSELKIKEASTRRDLHIIQAVNALDEYDKSINILSERVREWYGLHFPELSALIENINTYCDIILIGSRDDLNEDNLKPLGNRVNIILKAARESKGGDITNDSINTLKNIAKDLKTLIKSRDAIDRYLEKEMEEVAPNIKELVGANVGARLIAKAGGLDRLATLPASTIQVLGAEKALFRALKSKSKPPKHGIIFQHAIIHSSPKWQRGKIARALAANLALAARIDLYKGIKDPELLTRLNKRIEEIKERYKEMPKKEEKPKKVYKEKKRKKVKRYGKKRR